MEERVMNGELNLTYVNFIQAKGVNRNYIIDADETK